MRLLVSLTLEKREGACALFVQKTPDILFFSSFYCAILFEDGNEFSMYPCAAAEDLLLLRILWVKKSAVVPLELEGLGMFSARMSSKASDVCACAPLSPLVVADASVRETHRKRILLFLRYLKRQRLKN